MCNKELDGIKDKGENKGAQGKYNEWVIVGQDAELICQVFVEINLLEHLSLQQLKWWKAVTVMPTEL